MVFIQLCYMIYAFVNTVFGSDCIAFTGLTSLENSLIVAVKTKHYWKITNAKRDMKNIAVNNVTAAANHKSGAIVVFYFS